MQILSTKDRAQGFTIVELIVVITVLGLLIGLVLNVLGSFYQSGRDSLTQSIQTADSRSTLQAIEKNLIGTVGFLNTTAVAAVEPTGADNDEEPWSYEGNDTTQPLNRVLIASLYATDKPQNDPTRSLVYIDAGNCSASVAEPLQYNYVYFVKQASPGGEYNLYRRTMMPTYDLCSTPFQKQTCSSEDATSGAFTNCAGSDALLLKNVKNFTVDYFDEANSTEPIALQYETGGDITDAKSIQVQITTSRLVNGEMKDYTASLRISKLN